MSLFLTLLQDAPATEVAKAALAAADRAATDGNTDIDASMHEKRSADEVWQDAQGGRSRRRRNKKGKK